MSDTTGISRSQIKKYVEDNWRVLQFGILGVLDGYSEPSTSRSKSRFLHVADYTHREGFNSLNSKANAWGLGNSKVVPSGQLFPVYGSPTRKTSASLEQETGGTEQQRQQWLIEAMVVKFDSSFDENNIREELKKIFHFAYKKMIHHFANLLKEYEKLSYDDIPLENMKRYKKLSYDDIPLEIMIMKGGSYYQDPMEDYTKDALGRPWRHLEIDDDFESGTALQYEPSSFRFPYLSTVAEKVQACWVAFKKVTQWGESLARSVAVRRINVICEGVKWGLLGGVCLVGVPVFPLMMFAAAGLTIACSAVGLLLGLLCVAFVLAAALGVAYAIVKYKAKQTKLIKEKGDEVARSGVDGIEKLKFETKEVVPPRSSSLAAPNLAHALSEPIAEQEMTTIPPDDLETCYLPVFAAPKLSVQSSSDSGVTATPMAVSP
ncbi:MAG: hypothetical protein HY939_04670 [Gammaproteobacteria bacterium]|nr:hypothetical protein [Gammaproteobacteria bacterium]